MKKPLSKIAYFLLLFFVAHQLGRFGFNWMDSHNSFLSWTGALSIIVSITTCLICGWKIGDGLADAVIYWRSNRRK